VLWKSWRASLARGLVVVVLAAAVDTACIELWKVLLPPMVATMPLKLVVVGSSALARTVVLLCDMPFAKAPVVLDATGPFPLLALVFRAMVVVSAASGTISSSKSPVSFGVHVALGATVV